VWVVAESVVLYLGLPLVLGVATRLLVVRRRGEAGMDALKPTLNAISILGLLFTLIVMFALKGDLILERPAIVLELAFPMAIFFAAMFFTVLLIGAWMRFHYEDAVAAAFSATGRDFEIAIAIAITAFTPAVALATVVGPLIEVPVMLFFVWAATRLHGRLFGRNEAATTGGRGIEPERQHAASSR
jgi:ACR3 family arsenite transporter